MPLYKFECEGCGQQALAEMPFDVHDERTHRQDGKILLDTYHLREDVAQDPGELRPRVCGSFVQVFDFVFKRGMQEHYNHTTNTFVRNEGEFISDLHRLGDKMSARMGFDTNYEPVDGHDKEGLGVTDDGLEETERRLVNTGKVTPQLYL